MTTSQKGLDLLKEFEGCRLEAYQDVGGIWTIGYGNTYYEDGLHVQAGDTITLERAEQLLKIILIKFEGLVENKGMTLNQNQYDAFVSFTYNLGGNPLVDLSNEHINGTLTREKWVVYCHARVNGVMQVIPGLVTRRNKEYDLYSQSMVTPIVTAPVVVSQTPPVVPQNAPKQELPTISTNPTTPGLDDSKSPLFSFRKDNKTYSFSVSSTKVLMLIVGFSFVWLTNKGIISETNYMAIALAIISFYTGLKMGNNKP